MYLHHMDDSSIASEKNFTGTDPDYSVEDDLKTDTAQNLETHFFIKVGFSVVQF